MKKKVLFICIHNSARSQMAEAFFNEICGEHFEAHSAGLEPGKLNPVVVEVMREMGIDISKNQTKGIFDTYKSGKSFAYVITVCGQNSSGQRPIYPGIATRLEWNFPDPSTFKGTYEEKLAKTREVRDAIKEKIEQWYDEVCSLEAA